MMISRRYSMSSYKGLTAILKEYTERMLKKFADLIEPVSSMKMYAGSSAYTPRWHLFCLGQTVPIADYPQLYERLGGAASPWNTGTIPAGQFRVPDMRECVPVGVRKNTTRVFDSTELDPSTGTHGTQNHDLYTVGEFKDDQFQGHKHNFTAQIKLGGSDEGTEGAVSTHTSITTSPVSDGTNGTPRTGTTTHGKQVGLNYIIKY
jgi:microcystin-dependent protein